MKKSIHLKTIFVSFFFLLLLTGCQKDQENDCDYIKDYYPKIYQADYAFDTKNYQKAYQLYQEAFSHCKPLSTPDYDEIGKFTKASAAVKDYKTTLKYAKLLISMGKDLNFFENWSIFQDFLDSKSGQYLYDNYNYLKDQYKAKTNLALRQKIIDIIKEDKQYYTDSNISPQKRDSIDQVHKKKLKDVFEKYGYPNTSVIGLYAIDNKNTNLADVLLHIRDSSRIKYFIPKLRKFVKEGQTPPRILGNLVDQYRLYQGLPQKFATFVQPNSSSSQPSQDLKQIDKDRVSIGMPTLEMEEKKDSLNHL